MSTRTSTRRSGRRSHRPSTGRPLWQSPFTWLFALVIVAGVLAVVLSGSDGDTDVAQTGSVEVAGAPLPAFELPDPAVGLSVPAIEATTLAGESITIGADDGPRIYGLFAHWCPHCQAELPTLGEWLRSNDLPGDLEVIAISTSVDSRADNYPPSEWFEREEWPAPVVLDSEQGDIARSMGLTAFPYWVVTDGDGAVIGRLTGRLTTDAFEQLVALATS